MVGRYAKARLTHHRDSSAYCLAVSALLAAQDRRSFQRLDLAPSWGGFAKCLSLHLVAPRLTERMQPTNWSANGVFLAEEGLEVRRGLGGRTDGRFGTREVASGSADTVAPRSRECSGSSRTRLDDAMAEWRAAFNAAHQIEDAGERRRAVALASREMRYFADRLRTAQVVPPPTEYGAIAFGHRVTFTRDDGRRQAFRIVGEDEADPRIGSISYVSPVARALIGRTAGDLVLVGDRESEILSIA
jgi:transcription elongation GreA/GreB family factor